jgi:murein DD-endopeptidase MepM/ murein hydrolase activator NlpD
MKTYTPHITAVLIILIGVAGWWFFNSHGEWGKPVVKLSQEISAVGLNKPIDITFSDSGSGLRSINVTLSQDENTQLLSVMEYPDTGTREKNIVISIDPIAMKLHDGPAVLTASAVDHALWKNQTTLSKQIIIDTTPPRIYLLNPINNINPGGTCVIVYGTSEPVSSSGVKVENLFFRGYPTTISGKPSSISYFALPTEAKQGATSIKVTATDHAGNEASISLPHLIRTKKFKKDKMALSDNFMQQKMPEFQSYIPSLRGKTLLETFIYVNGPLRDENDKVVKNLSALSYPGQLWEGTFLRMNNAAPMALYGDKRTYEYQGKLVGESMHRGIDLASTANAPVEAANHGTVIYTGYLGIYGNVTVLDHGLGLLSLYAHLNSIHVTHGQQVKKGETIGRTGTSGLAGGDHLHFGMIVGGQFVNPQEWWDPHWIADNVNKKTAVSF